MGCTTDHPSRCPCNTSKTRSAPKHHPKRGRLIQCMCSTPYNKRPINHPKAERCKKRRMEHYCTEERI
eukprot:12643390-Ditylum_brightwellii.AAC.1